MKNLNITYRLQLHKDFNLEQLESIVSYLEQLGVETIYASPIFDAVPGSVHGYDGIDPNQINPEIGNETQLLSLSKKLRLAGIKWLQDIVPNHMAFDYRNSWLTDLLELGEKSAYADFFDRIENHGHENNRLMVPFLGSTLDEAIDSRTIKIDYRNSRFVFNTGNAFWPVHYMSYAALLGSGNEVMPPGLEKWIEEFNLSASNHLDPETWKQFMDQLSNLMCDADVKSFIDKRLVEINEDLTLLKKIEEQQIYRLCHWQETDQKINFRRFFIVNALICVNMQHKHVFDKYHELVTRLVNQNVIQGLRLDHIDGLFNPEQYLERLRNLVGDEVPILVEKILEKSESLPELWPVQGTTGYDFLALVNNLFTNMDSERRFSEFYQQLVNDARPTEVQVHEKKSLILDQHMQGELENLFRVFSAIYPQQIAAHHKADSEKIKKTIAAFLIYCPVYRFYGNQFPLGKDEADSVQHILDQIKQEHPELGIETELLQHILLELPQSANEELLNSISHFYQRCMQFTGPLMAKGVEDTLMYCNNSFIAHNEVGDASDAFGISVSAFHKKMQHRQSRWNHSLNATSTHDTKRGEDVRARLNVLSDLPEEWLKQVSEWVKLSKNDFASPMPDINDSYFIFQTLSGCYPMPGEKTEGLEDRLQSYFNKAFREAKTYTTWDQPNEKYESVVAEFVKSLLSSSPFMKSFSGWQEKITDHGIVNSLAQQVLKFSCPGIPDVYQGCELWDLSLVDPDNRRPVDYEQRKKWLQEIRHHGDLSLLWKERNNGKIKLWLVHQLCHLRRQYKNLFEYGEYLPLEIEGRYKQHVFAFARSHRKKLMLIIVPLHTAILSKEQNCTVEAIDWKDTCVNLPEGAGEEWINLFDHEPAVFQQKILLRQVFKNLPFCILKGNKVHQRGAGLLLHVSSLPSRFGIGDLGPESRSFADFLYRSHQQFWQVLPLNPVESVQGYSPYSSISSCAGNVLFISPESLVKEGLLDENDLNDNLIPNNVVADYSAAAKLRDWLFEKAWQKFQSEETSYLRREFHDFKQKEKYWLDDFALYSLIKKEQAGKPWYEWPDHLKLREEQALENFQLEHATILDKIKWLQFVFSGQWHALKKYCNAQGIEMLGDVSFYVSYDSADVWSHPHLFALDESGNLKSMAGVPPDAFSEDGQLWGMPVYNWKMHKKENYIWWINRLKKNLELFDRVRLDHFRAFSAFWEVEAGETTARKGRWAEGPGAGFFEAIEKKFSKLPFIAEDLGEIDGAVYRLRDQFRFPGMKVLQFAFGEDLPRSIHIPHNYQENFVVYTGTHDNNTTRGWFTREAGDQARLRLESYLGRSLSAEEVSFELTRMAFASVAQIAIIPLQDVLNLDENSRMNFPGTMINNWTWRLMPGELTTIAEHNLSKWAKMYGRSE